VRPIPQFVITTHICGQINCTLLALDLDLNIMTYGCEACVYDSEQMILGMLLMKCIFRKDQLVTEHLVTLYHEGWTPTYLFPSNYKQPSKVVSLHWSS
jgi:hypothetical protein